MKLEKAERPHHNDIAEGAKHRAWSSKMVGGLCALLFLSYQNCTRLKIALSVREQWGLSASDRGAGPARAGESRGGTAGPALRAGRGDGSAAIILPAEWRRVAVVRVTRQ